MSTAADYIPCQNVLPTWTSFPDLSVGLAIAIGVIYYVCTSILDINGLIAAFKGEKVVVKDKQGKEIEVDNGLRFLSARFFRWLFKVSASYTVIALIAGFIIMIVECSMYVNRFGYPSNSHEIGMRFYPYISHAALWWPYTLSIYIYRFAFMKFYFFAFDFVMRYLA